MSKKLKSPAVRHAEKPDRSALPGFIYGVNPVLEALKEEGLVDRVIVARGRSGEDVRAILDSVKKSRVPFEFRDRSDLDRLSGGKSQGIAAFIKQLQVSRTSRMSWPGKAGSGTSCSSSSIPFRTPRTWVR